MARIVEAKAYFQGTCFPQKFVSVQIGFGLGATLEPGDVRRDVEERMYAACRRRVEEKIGEIMAGATTDETPPPRATRRSA